MNQPRSDTVSTAWLSFVLACNAILAAATRGVPRPSGFLVREPETP